MQVQSRETVRPIKGAAIAPACSFVIFGACGDLTRRLLMPALYDLACNDLLDNDFRIVGVDLADSDDATWRASLTGAMQDYTRDPDGEFYTPEIDQAHWGWLCERMSYVRADFSDDVQMRSLADKIAGNAVFYLAVPSRFFGPVVSNLGRAGLVNESRGFRRVVVEKPFGVDLASANALNAELLATVREDQIYRIDHFLGKEPVQNIMAMRFGNLMFEPLWRHEHIDHVQITVAETLGVEGRGGFYDPTGALRDMVPNHLFQLLAMVAMEPPNSFSAENVRNARQQLFDAVRPIAPSDCVRGQYRAGQVHGHDIAAYRDSKGVASDSATETYVALKVRIDNWRWSGVPFYLRTGKALAGRRSEICVQFRTPPLAMFAGEDLETLPANRLVFALEPERGLSVHLAAKQPGVAMVMAPVDARFSYEDAFEPKPGVGYETLIYDCLMGHATLFQRADNIAAAWRAVDPLIKAWRDDTGSLEFYAAGDAGPKGADELLARDGRAWLSLS